MTRREVERMQKKMVRIAALIIEAQDLLDQIWCESAGEAVQAKKDKKR